MSSESVRTEKAVRDIEAIFNNMIRVVKCTDPEYQISISAKVSIAKELTQMVLDKIKIGIELDVAEQEVQSQMAKVQMDMYDLEMRSVKS